MIKIAHLYYDLLNLYGENGNIRALEKALASLNIEYVVDNLSIEDELDFSDYDFLYIGSGTEENEKIALNHLINYKESLSEYINNNKVMLVTGNTVSIFANKIKVELGNIVSEGLGIINSDSVILNKRIVCESLFKSNKFENDVIGFQNRGSCLENISDTEFLFDTIVGIGANNALKSEGIIKNNFYATYLIGPILVRNPDVLLYFLKLITKIDDIKLNLDLPKKAYDKFKEKYYSK